MKVCLLAPHIYQIRDDVDMYGGTERLLTYLLKKLQHKVEFTLIAPIGSKIKGIDDIIETVDAPNIHGTQEEGRAYEIYKDIIKERDFDLIEDHSHMGGSLLQTDFPVLKTFHGLQIWPRLPREKCNLVTESRYHKYWVKQRFGKQVRSKIIPPGIDISHYKPKYNKEDYFLFLGACLSHKNHSFAIMLAKKAGIKLKIAGGDQPSSGCDIQYVNAVIADCAEYDVEYIGGVNEQDKLELMRNAKAMILPFGQAEATSMIVREAMACATPVIASRLGGINEIIVNGETGYAFFPLDTGMLDMEGFISAIKQIDHIEPKNCRKYAVKHFGTKKYTDRYYRLYKKVANGEEW